LPREKREGSSIYVSGRQNPDRHDKDGEKGFRKKKVPPTVKERKKRTVYYGAESQRQRLEHGGGIVAIRRGEDLWKKGESVVHHL